MHFTLPPEKKSVNVMYLVGTEVRGRWVPRGVVLLVLTKLRQRMSTKQMQKQNTVFEPNWGKVNDLGFFCIMMHLINCIKSITFPQDLLNVLVKDLFWLECSNIYFWGLVIGWNYAIKWPKIGFSTQQKMVKEQSHICLFMKNAKRCCWV